MPAHAFGQWGQRLGAGLRSGAAAPRRERPDLEGDWTLPAGPYGYKAALNRSWTDNYGAKGEKEGGNIDFETTDGTVSFYYDHATHWVTSDEEGPIITAPGTFQSELGCSADWAPACMRPWLGQGR